jgi:very-short-patch-repair endonuclease
MGEGSVWDSLELMKKLIRGSQLLRQRARELRNPLTSAERRLWTALRDRRQSRMKFRRQHLIEFFIVDFYCAEYELVVEVDGDVHNDQVVRLQDRLREEWLEDRGYRFFVLETGCKINWILCWSELRQNVRSWHKNCRCATSLSHFWERADRFRSG